MAQQRPPPVAGDRPGDLAEAVQVGQLPASAATPTTHADATRAASRLWQARVALLLLAVSVGLWIAAAVIGFSRPRVVGVAGFGSGEVVASLVLLTFVGVGTLIVTRRPGNRIGWLFCAIGLPVLLGTFATQYAVVALLVGRPALPAGPAMAWLAGWVSVVGVSLFFYLLVLFPDGQLPSRRWRPVAWLYGGALALGLVTAAVRPGTTPVFLGDLGPIRNPLGWPQAAEVLGMVNGASRLVTTVLLPVAAVGLGLRLRRSRGVARQQLKWLAFAGAVLAGTILAEGLVQWLGRDRGTLGAVLGVVLILGGMLGIPVAAGVAILRYRLYAIDRIIRRTVVYGLLTALLGGTYAGLVLVLGQVFGRSSGLAVAIATLAVAAVFRPARRRIQQAVDRRFNRRRYNAAQTIAAFSVRLRDQVDLDVLTTEVLKVVDQTMEPTTVSLWLRTSPQHP
jgi:hypothetical protein